MFEAVILFFREILPGAVSLAAVILSGVALSSGRKAAITSTYFTEKTKAYNRYLDCAARFVFQPCGDTRDNFASALFQVRLFASRDIAGMAGSIYADAMSWSHAGCGPVTELDENLNKLGEMMRDDLSTFDRRLK